MGARSLLLFTHALLSYGLTVIKHNHNRDIISTSKAELTPLFISCGLNDMIIISAPIIYGANTQYHLNKPTGDIITLNITEQVPIRKIIINKDINVQRAKDDEAVITKENKYEVINRRRERSNFSNIDMNMDPSDFEIGPLAESDHGNWVLSVYYQDINGHWMELFQVITVEILENVPPKSLVHRLKPGETFEPSFAYPIKGLLSCEIIVPRSTFDRYYDRNRIDLDSCGFVVENVTREDQGIWTIIGVGSIVYETKLYLNILD